MLAKRPLPRRASLPSRLEIVAAEDGGALSVVDGVGRRVETTVAGLGVTALDTLDTNGDGVAEVFVGTSRGSVGRVDLDSKSVLDERFVSSAPVVALQVRDLDGDGTADFTFSDGQSVHVVDGRSRFREWSSERIGSEVGRFDSLILADLDGDGRTEIFVNRGPLGVRVYEVAGQPSDCQVPAPDVRASLLAGLCAASVGLGLVRPRKQEERQAPA
jgi:VCBS repeat protein